MNVYLFLPRMKDMKDKNLFGEDDSPNAAPPCITEVSLREIGTKIDFNALKSQTYENPNGSDVDNDDNKAYADWFLSNPAECQSLNEFITTSDVFSTQNRENELISKDNSPNVPTEKKYESSDGETENDSSDESEQTRLLSGTCSSITPTRVPNGHLPNQYIQESSEGMCCNNSDEKHLKTLNKMSSKAFLHRSYSISTCDPTIDSEMNRKLSTVHSARRKSDMSVPIVLDDLTKEELLLLWKASEVDLGTKLDNALREKLRLEEKMASYEGTCNKEIYRNT